MRANVARLGVALTTTFLVVALGLTYWQLVAADSLNAQPSNPRLVAAEQQVRRGRILDRTGRPLAEDRREGDNEVRDYPLPAAAPVTGYHSLRYGNSGLEERYDADLRGAGADDALQQLQQRLLHRPVVGSDIVTTLDARIQQAAMAALGDHPGAIVVLDPKTGEVLALASSPSFDPGKVDEQFPALRDNPDAALLNRATQSAYVPGSTFKLVTASAALDKGLVNLDQPFTCTTAINLGGQPVDCRNSIHIPRLTFKQAFAWSSNRVFALTGLLLGFPGPINPWLDDHPPGRYPWQDHSIDPSAQVLEDYAARFGFGRPIPFDLPVAPSRLKDPSSPWSVGLLASTAFGQGELSVTALQMALAVAVPGDDGKLPRPYLVSQIRSPDGTVRTVHEPGGWIDDVVSQETASVLRAFLLEGVENGYAAPARIPGVKVGGKTGTAEVGQGQTPHAWFIGLAPVDAPRLAIAVVFEHGGSGAEVATPAGRAVLQVALDVYRPQGR